MKRKKITLITGGQRSGKSSFAESMALQEATHKKPIYLATSRIWDDEHARRIERHKQSRANKWETIEEEKWISRFNWTDNIVVMDCITLWATNFFYDLNGDVVASLEALKKEFETFISYDNVHYIIVTNEIGFGGVAENQLQRGFTDLQGWINQFVASHADEVFLMVTGCPLKIK